MNTPMAEVNVGDLDLSGLHGSLEEEALSSMDFLNEIAERHPDAISLAAGRPTESFFDLSAIGRHLENYHRHLVEDRGFGDEHATRTILQYGPARGVIGDLVARHLAVDEGVRADADSIVVTVGCQEAMFLVMRALRRDARDAVLAVSPTYVGLTGAARLADMPVLPVSTGTTGIDLDVLVAQVRGARADGLRPRACYVMPDFANPSAASMDRGTREALLDAAIELDLLLLEDNPYGLFHADSARLPTLKALDTERRVVYLGTFAKTVVPGARVGYVVADQRVRLAEREYGTLAAQLSRLKSMTTVNTSPIAQAVVAGKLLEHGASLVNANVREKDVYHRNLRHVCDGLERRLGDLPGVSWNTPRGGYFVVVDVPFVADDRQLETCAEEYGVLWTPMSYFYAPHGGERQLRLSCSALSPTQIETGLDRFARYVRSKVSGALGV